LLEPDAHVEVEHTVYLHINLKKLKGYTCPSGIALGPCEPLVQRFARAQREAGVTGGPHGPQPGTG
jgi:hypothetical protein